MKKIASCLLIFAFSSCSGRNIHPELKPDPHVLLRTWTLPTHGLFEAGDHGTEFSNPVLADNTLVFGNRSVGLVALFPSINQQRWVLPIRGGVVSEITVEHGSIYFGGGDGFLYSVSLDTGRVNWRYEVRNPIISRPTLSDGRLFITSTDDTIYGFDSGTGKWLWHYRRRTAAAATILGASAPLVDGNEVIAGLSDGYVVSLNVADGQLKWERKIHSGTKFTDVDAHPVLESGIIYVPSYDGALYALKRQGGEVIWRFDSGGSKDVVLEDQKIYLPSSDGYVYCLEKANGKLLWRFELDKGTPTRLAVTDRYLIVGSSFQYIYAIDKETGVGVYRYNAGFESGFSGSSAYDPNHDRVYFLSGAGNLYAFALQHGMKQKNKHGATDPWDTGKVHF